MANRFFVFFTLIIIVFYPQYSLAKNIVPHFINNPDTSIESSSYLPIENVHITDAISQDLINNNPIFSKFWDNNHLFAYPSLKLSDLPDSIHIALLKGDEKFNLTWYGLVTSGYGQRWGRKHEGLDLALHTGDSVIAAFDGVVRFAKFTNSGYGNCIIIRHINGLETLYGHLSKIIVSENQFIKSGELIGLGGTTGRSSGPHLHFETRLNDYSFNPNIIINTTNQKLFSDSLIILKQNLFVDRFAINTNTINKSTGTTTSKYLNKKKKKVVVKTKAKSTALPKRLKVSKINKAKLVSSSKIKNNKKLIKKNKTKKKA